MIATQLVNESAQGTVVSSTDRVGKNTLGKDDFLKLLLTQLGNQDPTAPTDSQAFIAQLAQFTSLEQSQKTNDTLATLVLQQTNQSQTNMATFVGKDVTFKSDHVTLTTDGATPVFAELGGAAANVTAVVVDDKGATVRTVQLGARAEGGMTFQWDGRKEDGSIAPAGNYKVRVTASSEKGDSIAVSLTGRGNVTGVSYAGDAPELLVSGGFRVRMSEIVEISQNNVSSNGRSTP